VEINSIRLARAADVEAATTTATTTVAPLKVSVPPKKARVAKRPSGRSGWLKCTNRPPDCGLLNDKMSLLWGSFKDLVDELQAKMDKNAYKWKSLEFNLNQQIDVLRNAKARFNMQLNEAVSNMNADREESTEKDEERAQLEQEYHAYMKQCKRRIEWIMYQDICAYTSIRAAVMKTSSTCPPENIVDCDWTEWVPSECSVSCDDSCPHPTNPYACGGWQSLARQFIQSPNSCGYRCPAAKRRRKCNQVKCPVNCVMSKWSGFSKCSKECEGGVQGRTRSVLKPPKNGGESCNTAQESRPCNTGSCDRDCRLRKWSRWSPCSVACGGGFQTRTRRVIVPIRGNGKCPKAKSHHRWNLRRCNTFACNGDEICVAKQDLVIAIDSSGSLREEGFAVIKSFASKLVDKYKGKYFGSQDMKIGVVQFGNGKIETDGTVAKALLIQGLTHDVASVKTKIGALTYKKGFTNMAQAFTTAERMFLLAGRQKAQSAILTLTDGKPSFLFQTNEKVNQLKDKHTKLFFAPVTEFKGKELALMKKWASRPWATNLVHVPGLAPLQADEGVFAQRMLVKFCPQSISPSGMVDDEKTQGYMFVREQGSCGTRGALLSRAVRSVKECSDLAEKAGKKAFSVGTWSARGVCYSENMAVDAAKISAIQANRADPPCAEGAWKEDALFNFYIILVTD
jgi:hypothetical protein